MTAGSPRALRIARIASGAALLVAAVLAFLTPRGVVAHAVRDAA